jgi:hypothetical protein
VKRRSVTAIATCHFCGEAFIPTRSDARYCSNAHRQAAYRQRATVTDTNTLTRVALDGATRERLRKEISRRQLARLKLSGRRAA